MRVTIIISGRPHEMDFAPSLIVSALITQALAETSHVAEIAAGWELRDDRGFLFDVAKPLADRAAEGDTIYLSPTVGAGG